MFIPGLFVGYAALLCLAGIANRFALNPDGIAYMRLAEYYATWDTPLMVSGYWGPMISWWMAPLIKVGIAPMLAARTVMAGSGLVFLWGCHRFFTAANLDVFWHRSGLLIAAGFGVFWSIRGITPDLMLAGWIAAGFAEFLKADWLTEPRESLRAGVFWGLAYLTKAIAFPVAVVASLSFVVAWKAKEALPFGVLANGWGRFFGVFLLLAAPWMLTLSIKYAEPTFSTSGKIAHAMAGPFDEERYHPVFRTLYAPEPGRITAWEDPRAIDYNYWSPFESSEYFRHQIRLVYNNAFKLVHFFTGVDVSYAGRMESFRSSDFARLIPGFDLFFLSLAGLLGCLIGARPWVKGFVSETRRWMIVPVVILCGPYLPVYLLGGDQRYVYCTFPFVWVAAVRGVERLALHYKDRREFLRIAGKYGVLVGFGAPATIWLIVALRGFPHPVSDVARELAVRMKEAGLAGPIAASARFDGARAGLYTAFYLQQPWHGDDESASPEDLKNSGARFVLLNRADPNVSELLRHPDFTDRDAQLFSSASVAREFPVKVFELKRRAR